VNANNPYAPVQDFLSNVDKFKIIESTLREGEQFANAYFDTETKVSPLLKISLSKGKYDSHHSSA
jgi:hypothetical protein